MPPRVGVDLFKREVFAHRKRLVGGFYAYENTVEIKWIGRIFEGKTDGLGQVKIDTKAPGNAGGELLLQAEVTDQDGRAAAVHQSVWVYGEGDWAFEHADSDRIDLLPGKKEYELEKARNFRSACRSGKQPCWSWSGKGILDTFVQHVSGDAPVIKVPIKPHYGPNAFVSALCVRGRTGESQPTALVDLGDRHSNSALRKSGSAGKAMRSMSM